VTAPGDCWYRGPGHQPAVGGCPRSCSGPVIYSERAASGDQLLYCETHALWRRKTIRLPLVRRMRPGEQPEALFATTPPGATLALKSTLKQGERPRSGIPPAPLSRVAPYARGTWRVCSQSGSMSRPNAIGTAV
jgi:hypothetical protein